jgi:hypothetical protein
LFSEKEENEEEEKCESQFARNKEIHFNKNGIHIES